MIMNQARSRKSSNLSEVAAANPLVQANESLADLLKNQQQKLDHLHGA